MDRTKAINAVTLSDMLPSHTALMSAANSVRNVISFDCDDPLLSLLAVINSALSSLCVHPVIPDPDVGIIFLAIVCTMSSVTVTPTGSSDVSSGSMSRSSESGWREEMIPRSSSSVRGGCGVTPPSSSA